MADIRIVLITLALFTPVVGYYQAGFTSDVNFLSEFRKHPTVCVSVSHAAKGLFGIQFLTYHGNYRCMAQMEDCNYVDVDESGVVTDTGVTFKGASSETTWKDLCTGKEIRLYLTSKIVKNDHVIAVTAPHMADQPAEIYRGSADVDNGKLFYTYVQIGKFLMPNTVLLNYVLKDGNSIKKAERRPSMPRSTIVNGEFVCKYTRHSQWTKGHVIALNCGGPDELINCHLENTAINTLKKDTVEKEVASYIADGTIRSYGFRVVKYADGEMPFAEQFMHFIKLDTGDYYYTFEQKCETCAPTYNKTLMAVSTTGYLTTDYIKKVVGGVIEYLLDTRDYLYSVMPGWFQKGLDTFGVYANKLFGNTALWFWNILGSAISRIAGMVGFGAGAMDLQVQLAIVAQNPTFYQMVSQAIQTYQGGKDVFVVLMVQDATTIPNIVAGFQKLFEQLGLTTEVVSGTAGTTTADAVICKHMLTQSSYGRFYQAYAGRKDNAHVFYVVFVEVMGKCQLTTKDKTKCGMYIDDYASSLVSQYTHPEATYIPVVAGKDRVKLITDEAEADEYGMSKTTTTNGKTWEYVVMEDKMEWLVWNLLAAAFSVLLGRRNVGLMLLVAFVGFMSTMPSASADMDDLWGLVEPDTKTTDTDAEVYVRMAGRYYATAVDYVHMRQLVPGLGYFGLAATSSFMGLLGTLRERTIFLPKEVIRSRVFGNTSAETVGACLNCY